MSESAESPVRTPAAAGSPTVPPAGPGHDPVPRWLLVSAGWSWRLMLLALAVVLVFWATAKVQLVFIAVFVAMVLTAVLRPLVDWYGKVMPRALAVALGLLTAVLFVGGLLAYVVSSVAGQWSSLSVQFADGLDQIVDFFENGPLPFTITSDDFQRGIDNAIDWVQNHGGTIASEALAQAGTVVEVFTGIALAVFCAVFFLARGQGMWAWFLEQLPSRMRGTWRVAGEAGWYTFSGYTRGTVLIALADGVLAFFVLLVLGVPLAAPLAVLVFIGAFIPLIGAPLAMVIAMVVALAANGVLNAVLVGVGIALVGQFEGHVLQPLVMGKQVSLHPVVVALVVTGGTLLAGILGAIIAVPLVAVAWAIFSRLRAGPSAADAGPPPDPLRSSDRTEDRGQEPLLDDPVVEEGSPA